MRFLLVAILFALAVAVFTAVTKFGYQSSLETELSQQAKAALTEAGLSGIEVDFDHHNAVLTGYVESAEEHDEALKIVAKSLPMAVVPPIEESAIAIKPTLPPHLRIEREADSKVVKLRGVLSINGQTNRELLVGRLHALQSVETVDNGITFDARQLPFPKTAELASLSESLIKHPGTVLITFEKGTLTIKGEVPNAGLKEGLMELANLIDATSIDDRITVPEPTRKLEPSNFSFTRNRFGVTISGTLADAESKNALLGVLKSTDSNLDIKERIETSDDYIQSIWEENAKEILPVVLTTLKGEMTAEFTPERARINGQVKTQEDLETVSKAFEAISSLPDAPSILMDVSVKESASDGPALHLLAVFNEGTLTLTGIVPSVKFFAALKEDLEQRGSEITLVDELKETPSAGGSEWVDQLTDLFVEFDGRLDSAVVTIKNDKVSLEGETLEPAANQLIQNVIINIFPSHFSIDNQLVSKVEEPFPTPQLAPEEATKLKEGLKALPIYFGSNSEIVDNDGKEKIEAIAKLIKEAAVPLTLKVTGFADNVGNAAYNRELSLRRANAVIATMVSNGITKDTMTSDSVGEDVSNVSRSERWKARRVEVSIVDEPSPSEAPQEGGQE